MSSSEAKILGGVGSTGLGFYGCCVSFGFTTATLAGASVISLPSLIVIWMLSISFLGFGIECIRRGLNEKSNLNKNIKPSTGNIEVEEDKQNLTLSDVSIHRHLSPAGYATLTPPISLLSRQRTQIKNERTSFIAKLCSFFKCCCPNKSKQNPEMEMQHLPVTPRSTPPL